MASAVVAFVVLALLDTGLRTNPELIGPDVPIDPTFGLPVPPFGLVYRPGVQLIGVVWAGLGWLGTLALALRNRRRTGSWLPLCLVVSAPLAAFTGVAVDVLGGAWMADGPYLHTVTVFGRGMGVFIFAAWSSYAIVLYAVFTVLSREPRTRVLWGLLAVAVGGDIVSEELMLWLGFYRYYGNQPLVLVHLLPWWWVPCNAVGCFLAAALAHRFRPRAAGWRALPILVVTPVSVLCVYGLCGLPSFVAVDSRYPWLPTQLLGLTSLVLAVLVFAAVLRLVLDRRPFDLADRPRAPIVEAP